MRGIVKAAGVTVLAAAVASSCGLVGGAGEPGTPKGFTRVQTERASFAYPTQWRKLDDPPASKSWDLIAGRVVDNHAMALVSVNAGMNDTTDPEIAGYGALAEARLSRPGFRILDEGSVEVEGAMEAYRFDFIFFRNIPGKGKHKIRTTDVTAVDGSGNVVVVRISGSAKQLQARRIERIVDSIVMTTE